VDADNADAEGYNAIYKDETRVSMTFSGGYSHRVAKSIASGYIMPPELSAPGTKLMVS